MSKSICGSRYTLNIENLNLLDLNVRKLTASTDITGSYLTASRVVATDANKKLVSSDITTTELNYLDGVSSAIQTQINSKQATIVAGTNLSFDGATLNAAAATITANRLAVSNGSGAIIASAVTDTEAGYLDGVSSAIQTQLNAKLNTTDIIGNRIDNLGFTGTVGDGNEWNVRISGGRTGVNNWNGAKASNEFSGSLALGSDFDGLTVGLRVTYDIVQRYGYFESDDRIKHKEYATTNCLAKVMSLTPKTYIKTTDMYPYDFVLADDRSNLNEGDSLGVECGFIAQEVLQSAEDNKYDELGFSVMGGDTVDNNGNTVEDKYVVNYNNLFCVAVGAIKELKTELDTLKARIAVLEA